jgi:hypothetical protein
MLVQTSDIQQARHWHNIILQGSSTDVYLAQQILKRNSLFDTTLKSDSLFDTEKLFFPI